MVWCRCCISTKAPSSRISQFSRPGARDQESSNDDDGTEHDARERRRGGRARTEQARHALQPAFEVPVARVAQRIRLTRARRRRLAGTMTTTPLGRMKDAARAAKRPEALPKGFGKGEETFSEAYKFHEEGARRA